MRLTLLSTVCAIGIFSAGTVAAHDNDRREKLKGEYGFTGSADCIVSGAGFTPDFRAMDGPNSASVSFAVIGIRKFNGDGTGSVKGTSLAITPRPTQNNTSPVAAGSVEFKFKFTYTVDGDGGWTSAMVPGTYQANHVTGPRTGQTSTVDVIPPVVGMIANGEKTLIAAHPAPEVERHFFVNEVEHRVCHRCKRGLAAALRS